MVKLTMPVSDADLAAHAADQTDECNRLWGYDPDRDGPATDAVDEPDYTEADRIFEAQNAYDRSVYGE